MTKIEFIETLRRNISSVGDYEFINETIQYYQNYIETEIRKGKTEQEVLEELGNPKLIAKSIIASRGGVEDVVEEEPSENNTSSDKLHIRTKNGKNIIVPLWLAKAGGIVCGIGAIVLVGFLAVKLLPVICVGVLAVLVYRFIRDNF